MADIMDFTLLSIPWVFLDSSKYFWASFWDTCCWETVLPSWVLPLLGSQGYSGAYFPLLRQDESVYSALGVSKLIGKPGSQPVFINKVLLEASYAHSFTCFCGCFHTTAAELSNCTRILCSTKSEIFASCLTPELDKEIPIGIFEFVASQTKMSRGNEWAHDYSVCI